MKTKNVKGLYKTEGTPVWVHCQYTGGSEIPISEDLYIEREYEPDISQLPLKSEYLKNEINPE